MLIHVARLSACTMTASSYHLKSRHAVLSSMVQQTQSAQLCQRVCAHPRPICWPDLNLVPVGFADTSATRMFQITPMPPSSTSQTLTLTGSHPAGSSTAVILASEQEANEPSQVYFAALLLQCNAALVPSTCVLHALSVQYNIHLCPGWFTLGTQHKFRRTPMWSGLSCGSGT